MAISTRRGKRAGLASLTSVSAAAAAKYAAAWASANALAEEAGVDGAGFASFALGVLVPAASPEVWWADAVRRRTELAVGVEGIVASSGSRSTLFASARLTRANLVDARVSSASENEPLLRKNSRRRSTGIFPVRTSAR